MLLPGGPNSFNFMQFLGHSGKIVGWHPPGELAPPPRGNPGSATADMLQINVIPMPDHLYFKKYEILSVGDILG